MMARVGRVVNSMRWTCWAQLSFLGSALRSAQFISESHSLSSTSAKLAILFRNSWWASPYFDPFWLIGPVWPGFTHRNFNHGLKNLIFFFEKNRPPTDQNDRPDPTRPFFSGIFRRPTRPDHENRWSVPTLEMSWWKWRRRILWRRGMKK